MNKRGQGLSINAIILIILAVVVLVVIIIGFVMGWDKIMPWIKPSNNVKEIADACKIACSTEAKYSYCSEIRKLNDGTNEISSSCYFFAKKKPEYGIAVCSALGNCDIADDEAAAKTACLGKTEGAIIKYLDVGGIKEYPCTAADIAAT